MQNTSRKSKAELEFLKNKLEDKAECRLPEAILKHCHHSLSLRVFLLFFFPTVTILLLCDWKIVNAKEHGST